MTRSSRAQRNVPPPAGAPGTTGAKAAMYARFIPREELSSFAAWSPGDLAGAGPTPASPGAAAAEPAATVDPVQQHAEAVKQARQSGYQDGYRDGLVALEGFKQSFAAQTTTQVGALVRSVGEQLDVLQQEMARAIAATAAGLARQVLRAELEARPERVAIVAEQALDALLLSARHIVLRVHPDDHALIAGASAEAIAARGARIVADAQIGRGGCRVESDIGLVDATIDERWRRAAASLGSELPWWDAPAPDPAATEARSGDIDRDDEPRT